MPGRTAGHWGDTTKVSNLKDIPERNTPLRNRGEAVVESFEEKAASFSGAKKVTFYTHTTYSKSGDFTKKKLEQIWFPGKPWWSIARLYQGNIVFEFTLVE